MNLPEVASRDEWLVARKELLAREKEASRARDALSAERRRLPMVPITKEYLFEGPGGKATLADMFEGRHQLIVYHFMFDPSWDEGCNACSPATHRWPSSRVRRWPRSNRTRRAWAGPCRGTRRSATTSTTTSTSQR